MPLAKKQQELIFGGGYIALPRRLGISCNVPLELDDVSTMAVGFHSYPDALEKYFPSTDCLSAFKYRLFSKRGSGTHYAETLVRTYSL